MKRTVIFTDIALVPTFVLTFYSGIKLHVAGHGSRSLAQLCLIPYHYQPALPRSLYHAHTFARRMVQRVVPERPWEKKPYHTLDNRDLHPCHIHRHSPAGRGRRKFWNRHVALPHRFDKQRTDADSHQQTFHSSMQLLAQKTLIYQSMKQTIDITHWNRREHFEFFSRFDDPFFGITTLVDFTKAYEHIKAHRRPFFLSSVHFLLKCVNETEAFRLRTEDGKLVQYDTIHVSPTIGREDGTFGFGFFEYHTDIDIFIRNAEKEIKRVKKGCGLSVTENTWRPDVIRYSALPWFAFSEMKHAGSIRTGDSVPRISTGKLTQENGRYNLPLSITVHHGLMDGRDVAEFLQNIEYHQNLL